MDRLAATHLWFERAVPNPDSKNFHTQLGCHLEEVEEMLGAVSTQDELTLHLFLELRDSLKMVADRLKNHDNLIEIEPANRAEFLDGLCDQIVTAVGVGRMAGMDILGAMDEVNDSNFSKFDKDGEPIFHPETRKIMKGPDYKAPNLAPFAAGAVS